MCTMDIYTYVYPDGHKKTSLPYGHSAAPAFSGPSSYLSPYVDQCPPSPTYTPRTSTPGHRSGDDSDRSYRGSTGGRHRRWSGVYVNGQKVDSNHHSRDRRERILLVDHPPTPPQTPPQAFAFPHAAPSSPSFANTSPLVVDATHRGPASRRPVIVDERLSRGDGNRSHIRIEVIDGDRSKDKHARQSKLTKIAKANAEIANRQPVPLKRTGAEYGDTEREEEQLFRTIRQLNIEERRISDMARVSTRLEELEAQQYQLRQRMRRNRVQYDDGVYRRG
ncbi:uncharacterized protein UV8b_03343 [Ustilaginoidea virens]|uniref:Uncharacterized protein n=1 Tax=Ustilaginoidea virens TaxID=1159556 RepID=A0A8E5MH09_USTVR|nr:uncharacterized protein UV8b_03343 [Ustilaginoidea virens]QUC19102.1 hypothetical protein UV8b_03343 [Ustilaginoidea virens]